MSAPLISDTAFWASCADAVATLLREIAAQAVLPRWASAQISRKADGSLLTDADMAVQHALAATLPNIYPAPLLGEETLASEQQQLWQKRHSQDSSVWIADPIDGTSNFASGLPWYGISVALVHQGRTVLGVTYAPALNQLWHASLNGGAFLNGQRLQLGTTPSTLDACLVGVDMTYLPAALRHAIADCSPAGIAQGQQQTAPWRGWRSLGASTLEWCALASGQIQAYIHGGQMPWDATAGRLIVAEAGGYSAELNDFIGTPGSEHKNLSGLAPTAYAAATPGVWAAWQDWLRSQST